MPILWYEDGGLPRRLPDGAEPLWHKLHGFLSYLMKCTMTGVPYQVLGYKGKQVRLRESPKSIIWEQSLQLLLDARSDGVL